MRELISKLFSKEEKTAGDKASRGVQPARIHLVRDRDIEWTHREQVAGMVRNLRAVGFETITSFRIREIDGIHLVGLAHRQAGYLAVIYEHRLAEVWCNLVAVYENGETLTLSNARQGRELEPMPGHEKHLQRGATIAALFKSFKRRLRDESRERVEPRNFVRVFEDAYAREIAWRSTGEAPPAAAPAAEEDRVAGDRVAGDRVAGDRVAGDPVVADRQSAPLFAAIAACDLVRVRECISRGLSIEGRDAYGRTLLTAAVATGDPRVVEILLAAGADVNTRMSGLPGDALGAGSGSLGMTTPLTAAIETGDADIVTLLLASGADLAAPGDLTPLQFAAQQGDPEVVSALLAAGAEVDERGEDGYTALLSAAAEGYREVVEMLVETGADVDFRCEKETAITLAAAAGAKDVVEYLAPRVKGRHRRRAEKQLAGSGGPEAGPAPDVQAKRLMQAAMNGKAAMVGKLLGDGVHPDAMELREEGESPPTPLMVATQEGHLQVMRLLIRAGANVDYADSYGTPLKRALNPTFMDAEKQPAVIRLLIESGADFERLKDDERRLLAAALKGV